MGDLRRINQRTLEPIDEPIADDLAHVLACMVAGSPLIEHPEVVRVFARYRENHDG